MKKILNVFVYILTIYLATTPLVFYGYSFFKNSYTFQDFFSSLFFYPLSVTILCSTVLLISMFRVHLDRRYLIINIIALFIIILVNPSSVFFLAKISGLGFSLGGWSMLEIVSFRNALIWPFLIIILSFLKFMLDDETQKKSYLLKYEVVILLIALGQFINYFNQQTLNSGNGLSEGTDASRWILVTTFLFYFIYSISRVIKDYTIKKEVLFDGMGLIIFSGLASSFISFYSQVDCCSSWFRGLTSGMYILIMIVEMIIFSTVILIVGKIASRKKAVLSSQD